MWLRKVNKWFVWLITNNSKAISRTPCPHEVANVSSASAKLWPGSLTWSLSQNSSGMFRMISLLTIDERITFPSRTHQTENSKETLAQYANCSFQLPVSVRILISGKKGFLHTKKIHYIVNANSMDSVAMYRIHAFSKQVTTTKARTTRPTPHSMRVQRIGI